jgi:transposase
VITMELLGKIRRMHVRDKMSERAIAKCTGLSRNTVHKWLEIPEEVQAPRYVRAEKFGKLTALAQELEQALKADAHRHKQDQRKGKGKALFAQIKASGYLGGYSRVTDFIREWRVTQGKKPHAFVPLKFDLGEAFQFDWSEEGLVVGGIYRRMQVSHMKLCASRAFWLVPDRNGNLFRCTSLGARVRKAWSHRSPDGAQIRVALSNVWQAREK